MEVAQYIILSDQQLALLARGGDSAAFEALTNRYRQSLYQLFVSRGIGQDDADDLLQETLVKIFLKLESYNSAYTFGQWAYTIARNTLIDYCRGQQNNIARCDYPDITPVDPSANPEQRFIIDQSNDRLLSKIARLPPRYRQLIEMRFLNELSYEEIARQLNIPLGTVSTQIHRARAKLLRF